MCPSLRVLCHCRMLVFAPVAVSSVKVQIDGVYLGEAEQSKGPLYVLEWEPFQYIGGLHSVVVQAVVSDVPVDTFNVI